MYVCVSIFVVYNCRYIHELVRGISVTYAIFLSVLSVLSQVYQWTNTTLQRLIVILVLMYDGVNTVTALADCFFKFLVLVGFSAVNINFYI